MAYYRMARGWMDNPALRSEAFCRRAAWAWMIEEAQWQERRVDISGRTLVLKRGQFSHSLRFMAKAWGWSEPSVRRFLTRLKTDAMIDAATDAGQLLITLCNYEKYQGGERHTDAATDAATDAGPTQERRKLNEVKKERKEEGSVAIATAQAEPKTDLFAEPEKPSAPQPEIIPPGVPTDPTAILYQVARTNLPRHGVPASRIGALVGKWRKEISDVDLMVVITEAVSMQRDNITAFIEGSIRARRNGHGPGSFAGGRAGSHRAAAPISADERRSILAEGLPEGLCDADLGEGMGNGYGGFGSRG